MIQDNLQRLRERIEVACRRGGRKSEEIQLVAVTKTVPAEMIASAVQLGLNEIGESRVQETQEKFQAVHSIFPFLKWHLIGNLQRNKVNRAVEIYDLIQSVDSKRLAEALDQRARRLKKIQDCLVELKVSDEPKKMGMKLEEIEDFIGFSQSLKNLRIKGIMTMAPYFENSESARPYFARVRKVFEQFFLSPAASLARHPILSMGMSGDFEAAIAEGSTMIRIGTALFQSRNGK